MVQEKTTPQESRLGPKRRRFSNAEFLRMLEAGFFDQPPRVELINGEILEVDAVGPKHAFAVANLVERLNLLISEVFVWPQCPLQIPQESTPLPDIVLLQLPKDQYKEQLPQPNQALLVIEVADSSLEFDRKKKRSIFAKAAIPEYWIVNLVDKQLEAYQPPMGKKYRSQTLYDPGQTVQALCLSGSIQWDQRTPCS